MKINSTKTCLLLFFLALQTSPVFVWQIFPKQSDWELKIYSERHSECFEKYLSQSIESYKEAERKTPDKVFGGVEKITADYTVQYTEMCDEIVKMRYFSASYFLLFILSIFLFIPASWISANLTISAIAKPSKLLISALKIFIALIMTSIGAIIAWGACLPVIYVPVESSSKCTTEIRG